MAFKVTFIGGSIDGEVRILEEKDIHELGYRVALSSVPIMGESTICYAAPNSWSSDEAHRAIRKKLNSEGSARSGKKSR